MYTYVSYVYVYVIPSLHLGTILKAFNTTGAGGVIISGRDKVHLSILYVYIHTHIRHVRQHLMVVVIIVRPVQ